MNHLTKQLAFLKSYIEETNASNKTNDKIAVLKKYSNNEFVKKVLYFTYNDQLQFNITSDSLLKNPDLVIANTYNENRSDGGDLFALLMDLHYRKITGHLALSKVNGFLNDYAEYKDIILLIIDRNLETRVTATIINKVIKGLIPEFKVALGVDWEKLGKKQPNILDGTWLASRKMDGLRALTFIHDINTMEMKSRTGNTFHSLQKLLDRFKEIGFSDLVLDGEVCLINEDGSDDFTGIQSEYNRKNHTVENARYRIFDVLTHEEFNTRKSKLTLSERLERLNPFLDKMNENDVVRPVEQIRLTSAEQYDAFWDESIQKNWEGLIVRRDIPYEGKRSKNLIKVKLFIEGEFTVIDVVNASQRVIESGKEIDKVMLKTVVIEYNGYRVDVGSGFSKAEREMFYADKHLIVGKEITVKYKKVTKNKQGGESLQFPIFKCIKDKF